MLERTGGGGERVGGSSGGSAGWVPKVLEANYSPDPTRILQYCPRFYNQVHPPGSPPGSPLAPLAPFAPLAPLTL